MLRFRPNCIQTNHLSKAGVTFVFLKRFCTPRLGSVNLDANPRETIKDKKKYCHIFFFRAKIRFFFMIWSLASSSIILHKLVKYAEIAHIIKMKTPVGRIHTYNKYKDYVGQVVPLKLPDSVIISLCYAQHENNENNTTISDDYAKFDDQGFEIPGYEPKMNFFLCRNTTVCRCIWQENATLDEKVLIAHNLIKWLNDTSYDYNIYNNPEDHEIFRSCHF